MWFFFLSIRFHFHFFLILYHRIIYCCVDFSHCYGIRSSCYIGSNLHILCDWTRLHFTELLFFVASYFPSLPLWTNSSTSFSLDKSDCLNPAVLSLKRKEDISHYLGIRVIVLSTEKKKHGENNKLHAIESKSVTNVLLQQHCAFFTVHFSTYSLHHAPVTLLVNQKIKVYWG